MSLSNTADCPTRSTEAGHEPDWCNGWWIHTRDRVGSTSTVAAPFSAWHAVRANTQCAGRGRTGRPWVSDLGGLWISAVLPCPAEEPVWQFLPLATGWALACALGERGVCPLRLRWPNDLMVGRRKLAGLLVERFNRDTIVVGIGINVFNTPERLDPKLAGTTARLADLIPAIESLDELALMALSAVRLAHEELRRSGFCGIAKDLNARWTEPRRVELTLAGRSAGVCGRFAEIDERGALHLVTENGVESTYDATRVALLRELD